jgi:uncharacterized membrane protein
VLGHKIVIIINVVGVVILHLFKSFAFWFTIVVIIVNNPNLSI